MAKNEQKAAEAEANTAEEAKTDAAPAANGADGRHIVITDPDNGQPIKRVDFIRREVIERGRSRGDVARQLTEIQGKKVLYQVVFAATKDHKPAKAPEAAPAEASKDAEAAENAS